MTNKERQAAIEWLKGRPITMPGAKKMYDLAIEALEMYVPEMNVGDMISRQAALEMLMAQNVIMDGSEYHNGFNAGVNRAQEVIRNLPPVQPKRGKWIDAVIPNDNGDLLVQVCDQCNTFFPLAYTGGGHHFCPNCGADMRGEAE